MGKYGQWFVGDFKINGKMGYESRFTNSNPFYKRNLSPGPAAYALQTHKSIHLNTGGRGISNGKSKMSQTFYDSQGLYSSTFGNGYERYKNVYHQENFKDFQNREGPGPGSYNYDSAFNKTTKSLIYSFPK